MNPHPNRRTAPRAKPLEAATPPYPQTPESALKWLKARGIAVTELARTHDVPRMAFVDLLRKKARGHRGATHRAAVLLGLKPDPQEV